jgi:hypothetical protein
VSLLESLDLRAADDPVSYPKDPNDSAPRMTRRIPESIERAGFERDQLDTYYFQGEPKEFGYTSKGEPRNGPEDRSDSHPVVRLDSSVLSPMPE